MGYGLVSISLNFIFQQDNDSKHTAHIFKVWFIQVKVNVLPWSSQSPDLNPIEILWDIVVKDFYYLFNILYFVSK